jgi:hypothetical protein
MKNINNAIAIIIQTNIYIYNNIGLYIEYKK